MTLNKKIFSSAKYLTVDSFFNKVLFDKKFGYYSSKFPFGNTGDFITAPVISNLFSEIIAIWFVSTWEELGKPKKINLVELGPGDGSLIKVLAKTFKNFPEFEKSVEIFLYEKSSFLIEKQKKNIKNKKIKWIQNFTKIKNGPIIFFGNEFFDAIPIKQFIRKGNLLLEKCYSLDKDKKIVEIYKKISKKNFLQIKRFKSLKNLNFIEFPKLGLNELNKINEKISKNQGGLLLIDYGYLEPRNKNTLQSVMKHKKNNLLDNLGRADVTSLVNFKLLNEYFINNNLKVEKIVTQKIFLEKMGIIERANNLSFKMNFIEKSNLYLRLKRLLDKKLMGNLFKVIFAHNFKKSNFLGFK